MHEGRAGAYPARRPAFPGYGLRRTPGQIRSLIATILHLTYSAVMFGPPHCWEPRTSLCVFPELGAVKGPLIFHNRSCYNGDGIASGDRFRGEECVVVDIPGENDVEYQPMVRDVPRVNVRGSD